MRSSFRGRSKFECDPRNGVPAKLTLRKVSERLRQQLPTAGGHSFSSTNVPPVSSSNNSCSFKRRLANNVE